jgi:ATP-dependent helicase/nuclease subunit B
VDGGPGMLAKGKLQLQLYLLAARELWGLELAGGLYRPLGARNERDRKPKGLLRKSVEEDLAGLDPRPRDHVDDEAFERALDEAREKTEEIIAAIQAGDIGRRPIDGSCPSYCHFQPICRRDRADPEDEPGPEAEEEG